VFFIQGVIRVIEIATISRTGRMNSNLGPTIEIADSDTGERRT